MELRALKSLKKDWIHQIYLQMYDWKPWKMQKEKWLLGIPSIEEGRDLHALWYNIDIIWVSFKVSYLGAKLHKGNLIIPREEVIFLL